MRMLPLAMDVEIVPAALAPIRRFQNDLSTPWHDRLCPGTQFADTLEMALADRFHFHTSQPHVHVAPDELHDHRLHVEARRAHARASAAERDEAARPLLDLGVGLDHVLASGKDVNVLVMDTEVYSNTGGQASKATGLGAIAKFAAGGKPTPKKDLARIMMSYGNIYVAQVAMGANENQLIKAFQEAESYNGPSIVIAYSPCIAHGINMAKGFDQQKLAVSTGHWPIFRYDPRLKAEGKNPLQLDSRKPKGHISDYIYNEQRYKLLTQINPRVARELLEEAQKGVHEHWASLEQLATDPVTEEKE